MADTPFQKKFKSKLAQSGYKSVKDIPKDKKDDFFNMIDDTHQSKKEKKGDYSESMTRAQHLLSLHNQIEEEFYKTNKGKKHSNRKSNGMDNVTPRD